MSGSVFGRILAELSRGVPRRVDPGLGPVIRHQIVAAAITARGPGDSR